MKPVWKTCSVRSVPSEMNCMGHGKGKVGRPGTVQESIA